MFKSAILVIWWLSSLPIYVPGLVHILKPPSPSPSFTQFYVLQFEFCVHVCCAAVVTLGSPIFSHGFPLRRGTWCSATDEGPESPWPELVRSRSRSRRREGATRNWREGRHLKLCNTHSPSPPFQQNLWNVGKHPTRFNVAEAKARKPRNEFARRGGNLWMVPKQQHWDRYVLAETGCK